MGTPTKRQPKALIYDPYLDSLGGGERYCLSLAEILLKHHWQVDVAWSGSDKFVQDAKEIFSLQLDGLKVVTDLFNYRPCRLGPIDNLNDIKIISQHHPLKLNIFCKLKMLLLRYRQLRHYDLLFYIGDGSIPFLFSKKNLLHIQVPLTHQPNGLTSILNHLKLLFINRVVFNSKFTQDHTSYIPQPKSFLLYPPVDVDKFILRPKQNTILSVGRFDDILNIKRQDVLITAFKKLIDTHHLTDWKLILAGGSLLEPQYNNYPQQLKQQANGYPIDFVVKPNFSTLKDLYSTFKLYWHAAGFEVNQDLRPDMTEHFGITIVEAMASATVPLVVNRGGLPEIIRHQQNGYLWNNIDELIDQTINLISHPELVSKFSDQSLLDSKLFSKNAFEQKVISIIQ